MEFEDSRNAIYHDPNAYIQKFEKKCDCCEPKKVVFQEPYERLPNFHLDNGFKKHNCDCLNKHKPNQDCNHRKEDNSNHPNMLFDLKNLLPLLSGLNKGGGDMSNLISMLSNVGGGGNTKGGFDLSSLVSMFAQNKNGLGGLFNLFGNKNKSTKKEIKSTDFEIKNYTRVE